MNNFPQIAGESITHSTLETEMQKSIGEHVNLRIDGSNSKEPKTVESVYEDLCVRAIPIIRNAGQACTQSLRRAMGVNETTAFLLMGILIERGVLDREPVKPGSGRHKVKS